MRSYVAALILSLWIAAPAGTALVAWLAAPHCHCPGHRAPTGPAFAPCASFALHAAPATPCVTPAPATLPRTAATPRTHPVAALAPRAGPAPSPAVPPPKA